ncbi:hypothetical protein KQX54_008536 [Cotesia glomerata]|uniref:Uncharacterized protein n=1 Tax=Cotesia glomerata TaxID=32391 RepID=A0AAV7HRW1_COTGL|nr:hypothetical protein KQX54_008536 [Cotesia glomerata]
MLLTTFPVERDRILIKPLREPVVIIPVNSMDQNCGLINKTNNRSFNLKAVLNRIPIDREKSRYLEKVV